MNLNITGAEFKNTVKIYQIAVPELNAKNIPGKEPIINIQESELKKIPEKILVAPLCVSLYVLELK